MTDANLAAPAAALSPRARHAVLGTLALLYTAQGIPFGFAAEYLPVVLRQAHYTRAQIAAVFWLQLPWQMKILWARVADHPTVRPRARAILLALQLLLAGAVALYAPFDVSSAAVVWFVLTALCALLAATQDIFVDALAVRSLAPSDRGFGNVAQVAGYRLGMLAGGAGLLLAVGEWGQPRTLLACAAVIAAAGVGAFALRQDGVVQVPGGHDRTGAAPVATAPSPLGLWGALRHVVGRETWRVAALVAVFKLGPHVQGAIIKPMLVDAHWTPAQIGWAAVTVGTASALLGAAVGGWVFRTLRDRNALATAAALHALAGLPLVAVALAHAPYALSTAAIAVEHFASGLGTTVLFAALMTATRPSSAGLHYTVLTSINALALGLGGLLGGLLGDRLGEALTYALGAALSLLPLALLPGWERAAHASARE